MVNKVIKSVLTDRMMAPCLDPAEMKKKLTPTKKSVRMKMSRLTAKNLTIVLRLNKSSFQLYSANLP